MEDEGIIASDIEAVLKWAGHRISGIAASSEEVFANIEVQHPDLILMDIHIDGPLDGIQTVAKIRETFDIPIIYLSAQANRQTLDRAKATGAFEFFTKPFNSVKLLLAVEGTVEKYRASMRIVN